MYKILQNLQNKLSELVNEFNKVTMIQDQFTKLITVLLYYQWITGNWNYENNAT